MTKAKTSNEGYTVVLELTQREAESLTALVLRGPSWGQSGKLGVDAENIREALNGIGVETPDAKPVKPIYSTSTLMVWSDPR